MGPAAARAIKAASSSVPIVAFTSFPVKSGVAASLARPGGNLTGVSLITTELDAKRLSLLGEFIPNAKRIAVLRDPAVSAADHIPQLETTAHSLGVALEIVEANRPDAIEAAVQLARSHGVRGFERARLADAQRCRKRNRAAGQAS